MPKNPPPANFTTDVLRDITPIKGEKIEDRMLGTNTAVDTLEQIFCLRASAGGLAGFDSVAVAASSAA